MYVGYDGPCIISIICRNHILYIVLKNFMSQYHLAKIYLLSSGWHFRSEKINVFFSSFIFTDHLTDNNQTVPDFFPLRPFSFLERWVNVRLATREFSKVWIQDLIFLKIYCLEFLSIVLSHEYKCFSYRFQFLECSRTALHGNKFYSTGCSAILAPLCLILLEQKGGGIQIFIASNP